MCYLRAAQGRLGQVQGGTYHVSSSVHAGNSFRGWIDGGRRSTVNLHPYRSRLLVLRVVRTARIVPATD